MSSWEKALARTDCDLCAQHLSQRRLSNHTFTHPTCLSSQSSEKSPRLQIILYPDLTAREGRKVQPQGQRAESLTAQACSHEPG